MGSLDKPARSGEFPAAPSPNGASVLSLGLSLLLPWLPHPAFRVVSAAPGQH
jgi:hypothetical protein